LMPARHGAEGNHTFPSPDVPCLVTELKRLGYEVAAMGKVAHGRPRDQWAFDVVQPASGYQTLRRNVRQFLRQRDSDKPLCLFVGISNPHVPWPLPAKTPSNDVSLPPTFIDTPTTRTHRAAYCDEIKQLDQWLGELRELATERLGSNLIFAYSSDHGGQWPYGKWTLYDYGVRVPLVVSWPGVVAKGSVSHAMVSWIDLLPTLIELTSDAAPMNVDGQSFADVLRGKSDSHRDRVFLTHTGDQAMNVYPCRAVRTSEWKLIHNLRPDLAFTSHSDLLRKPGAGAYWTEWVEAAEVDQRARDAVDRYYRRPEWELYRISDDPWETRNLAAAPEHADVLAELRASLQNWCESQGDQPRLLAAPRPLNDRKTWAPEYWRDRAERP
ncbi:MAG: sulfatase-like hydrolase/transferase, partial [Planctomycetales bacterium]|nr:sulfatase-like hydrolase/transferase [Planctomycetales bacterium]